MITIASNKIKLALFACGITALLIGTWAVMSFSNPMEGEWSATGPDNDIAQIRVLDNAIEFNGQLLSVTFGKNEAGDVTAQSSNQLITFHSADNGLVSMTIQRLHYGDTEPMLLTLSPKQ